MRKKVMMLLTIACVALTAASITIWCVLNSQSDLEQNTEVTVNGETKKTFKAELEDFYPGKAQDYKITLSGDLAEHYVVTLKFRDDNKHGELENYIIVKIATKEKRIEKPLADLLKGEDVVLGSNANEITITYEMRVDAGNESQGTAASFFLELHAKNE